MFILFTFRFLADYTIIVIFKVVLVKKKKNTLNYFSESSIHFQNLTITLLFVELKKWGQ